MRKKLFALFLPALCLLAASCAKNGQDASEIKVKTALVQKKKESVFLETFGSVTYRKKNEVLALVEGTVFELNVQEGSKVNEGDVLLRLKNIQYEIQRTECENQLNSAKARLRAARNDLILEERNAKSRLVALENSRSNLAQKKDELSLLRKNVEKNKALLDAGGISESAFERMSMECASAATEVEVLEKEIMADELGFRDQDLLGAGIEPSGDDEEKVRQLVELNTQRARIQIELSIVEAQNAEQNLKSINSLIENLTVRAPSSGIVGALKCENGERVTQNQNVLTLIDMAEPYAQVTVQERDMEKIAIGSPALVKIDSLGQKQKSAVAFISPLAEFETGNFYVKIPLKNDKDDLRFGMFAQCSIESKRSGDFFALPREAVLFRNGNNVAFYCVQNGYVFQKECAVEMERDGKLFVAGGLEDGDKIIVNPSQAVKEGVHVKEL